MLAIVPASPSAFSDNISRVIRLVETSLAAILWPKPRSLRLVYWHYSDESQHPKQLVARLNHDHGNVEGLLGRKCQSQWKNHERIAGARVLQTIRTQGVLQILCATIFNRPQQWYDDHSPDD